MIIISISNFKIRCGSVISNRTLGFTIGRNESRNQKE